MIEVTDEMIYAFAGEPEITGTDAHFIRRGLEAVLEIVNREHEKQIEDERDDAYEIGRQMGRRP